MVLVRRVSHWSGPDRVMSNIVEVRCSSCGRRETYGDPRSEASGYMNSLTFCRARGWRILESENRAEYPDHQTCPECVSAYG